MREELIQYVKLLFAGTPDSEDMQQEILQNTLDRYDDLISQGKSSEAAYRLAISGIGDIGELLGRAEPCAPTVSAPEQPVKSAKKKIMCAVAIGLYICCVIPVIALANIGDGAIGVCLMFVMIAAATVLIILSSGSSEEKKENKENVPLTPQQELRRTVQKALSTVSLVLFLVISFLTGAWYITWLIFPIMGAVRGIVFACMDLKEAKSYEA